MCRTTRALTRGGMCPISSCVSTMGRALMIPLNLILEVKGYRHEDVKDKSGTMRTHWVPGVNNLAVYGPLGVPRVRPNRCMRLQEEFNSLVMQAMSQYYSTLDFKELLAAAPLEGIDLTRPRAFAREVEL